MSLPGSAPQRQPELAFPCVFQSLPPRGEQGGEEETLQQEPTDHQALGNPVGRGLLNSTNGGGDQPAFLRQPWAGSISTAEGDPVEETVSSEVISFCSEASLMDVLSSGWSISSASGSSSESASLVSVLSAFGDPAELCPLSETSSVLPGISVEQGKSRLLGRGFRGFEGGTVRSILCCRHSNPRRSSTVGAVQRLPRLPRRRPQRRSVDGSGWSSMWPRLAELILSRRGSRCADSSGPGPSGWSSPHGSGAPRGGGVR